MTAPYRMPELPRSATRLLPDVDSRWLDARYPKTPKPPRGCVTCSGRRTFRWYAPGTTTPVDYECPCPDQYALHRLLTWSGVGKGLQRLGWSDVHDCPSGAAKAIQEYVEAAPQFVDNGASALFLGEKGTGKTLLATLLLKELRCLHGIDCFSITFASMLSAFSAGWDDEEERVWFARRVRNAGVLLIDDLGREHRGARTIADSTLEEVLRHRTQEARPTFITTNLTREEIRAGYGGHSMSVLHERSGGMVCEFPGADWRDRANDRMMAEIRAGLTRPIVVS